MPALAYWYLEENYPLRIAIAGGLALSILELGLEKWFVKKIHTISLFNFILIVLLGGLSLLGDEGIWFKLQPSFTGVGIGIFLFVQGLRGKSLMIDMMGEEQRNKVPSFVIETMERHLSYLFFSYGLFMAYVATFLSTDLWVFFKTIGFYLTFAIFMVFELIFTRYKMRRKAQQEMKQELFRRL